MVLSLLNSKLQASCIRLRLQGRNTDLKNDIEVQSISHDNYNSQTTQSGRRRTLHASSWDCRKTFEKHMVVIDVLRSQPWGIDRHLTSQMHQKLQQNWIFILYQTKTSYGPYKSEMASTTLSTIQCIKTAPSCGFDVSSTLNLIWPKNRQAWTRKQI